MISALKQHECWEIERRVPEFSWRWVSRRSWSADLSALTREKFDVRKLRILHRPCRAVGKKRRHPTEVKQKICFRDVRCVICSGSQERGNWAAASGGSGVLPSEGSRRFAVTQAGCAVDCIFPDGAARLIRNLTAGEFSSKFCASKKATKAESENKDAAKPAAQSLDWPLNKHVLMGKGALAQFRAGDGGDRIILDPLD